MDYSCKFSSDVEDALVIRVELETAFWSRSKQFSDDIFSFDFESLNEPVRSLAQGIYDLAEVASVELQSFRITIRKTARSNWDEVIGKMHPILTGYKDPNAKRSKLPSTKPATQRRKNLIADYIIKGLNDVKEDHGVFVSSKTSPDYICGCALVIAAVGLGGSANALHIEELENGGRSTIEVSANILRIPVSLASKIDQMHRIEMISATEIARQLRAGEI